MVESTPIAGTGSVPSAGIISMLKDEFARLSGLNLDSIDIQASFVEMGADSLFLLRASHAIHDRCGVRIPFRMLFEELSTIEVVAEYLADHINPESLARLATADSGIVEALAGEESEPQIAVGESGQGELHTAQELLLAAEKAPAAMAVQDGLERVVQQQLQIMSKQLDLLRKGRGADAALRQPGNTLKAQNDKAQKENGRPRSDSPGPVRVSKPGESQETGTDRRSGPVKSAGTYEIAPIEARYRGVLSAAQRDYLDGLIVRLNARTRRSKEIAQRSRPFLADNRATAGYHPLWKELQYPLLVEKGQGARIWDVDGNEYVDLTSGFGALLFGHSPAFLTEAVVGQISQGMLLGAESPVAGEAARLICELTGVERATFCNSGTEAVMTALRLARTVTGRHKIAMFEGCYHGTFDQVIVRQGPAAHGGRPVPGGLGVPESFMDDVVLFNLDDKNSLDDLRSHAGELAAVLIEPMPSRSPHLDLKQYVEELRRITKENGVALIFDEVVTGFRFHPGGIQAMFGVQADLVTYGKAIGGGLPIGVVAGSAEYMNPIDGGMWRYGDGSYPGVEMTFFAGTYFKHPLIMPALVAVLNHIKDAGPLLQENMNRRVTALADRLNAYLAVNRMPVRVVYRASLFRFFFRHNVKFSDLFYYALLEKGVFISETRGCLLSTAHGDADLDRVVEAVKESLEEFRAAGFLPDDDPNATDWQRFGAPTPTALQQHVSNSGIGPSTALPVTPVGKTTGVAEPPRIASTAAQRDLWALAQMDDDASRAYNETAIVHFKGDFSLAALRRSILKVVNRHDATRTSFSEDGQQQIIRPDMPLEVPLIDFSTGAADDRQTRFELWLSEEVSRNFDLATGPLVRATVAKLAENHHAFVMVLHHIITDGNSNGILLREIAALYSADLLGTECELPRAPTANASSAPPTVEEIARAGEYWAKQVSRMTPLLNLPIDRPRPVLQTYAGARKTFTVSGSAYHDLKRTAASHGYTTFVVLLGAFGALLHRLTGQQDLIVGCPVGEAGNVGYNVNLLPIRSNVSGNPTFAQYLAEIRDTLLDAYEYKSYSLSSLIKKLTFRRDPSRPPLISAAFNSENVGGVPKFHGLEVEIESGPVNYTKFELYLNVTEGGDAWRFDLDYNTDLFDQSTITRWAGYLTSLVESIATNQDQRLSDLGVLTSQSAENDVGRIGLLSDTEIHSMISEWNQPATRYPVDCCIHDAFVQHAKSQPDSIAVTCESSHLTYRKIDMRSAQLANRLRSLGAVADMPVGICVDRTAEMVIGLIGILKSGAAYVPLDSVYPNERLDFIASDTEMKILVTEQGMKNRVPPSVVSTICLDQDRETLDRESTEDPICQVPPDAAAYVIYTSGSTGIPKGVVVSHRNVMRLFSATRADFGFSKDDVWSLFHSYAFDFSVWEIWGALSHGGRLVMVPYWLSRSHEEFHELATAEQVTVLNQTPSAFSQFLKVEVENARREPALRLIIFGGEALDSRSLKPWMDRYGDARPRLVNMYGITETTVHVTLLGLDVQNANARGQCLIGRPISDLSIYLADSYGTLAQIGAAAEMLVGGDGLARGYLKRPELTADRFIPDPFSTEGGGRLYRSGDLGRYTQTGEIDYLGRSDDQVKIRGFRIELGEIETVLNSYPAIRQCAVAVSSDGATGKRLAGYIVCKGSHPALTTRELRSFLADRLPDYMIPSGFVFLDGLPLTANGKLDRRALPALEANRIEVAITSGDDSNSQSEVERHLSRIWKEALRVGSVGIHDNFFELGGDSILAIQIVSKAKALGLKFTPKDIFQSQTVAALARSVESTTSTAAGDLAAAPSGLFALTPIQQWFFDMQSVEVHHFNHAITLEIKDGQSQASLAKAFAYLVRRHDALRLRFVATPDGWRQEVASPDGAAPFVCYDFSTLSSEELQGAIQAAANDVQRSLDLGSGTLAKAAYFDLGPARPGRLLLIIHHLGVDAVSWRVLLEEFQLIHKRLNGDNAVDLPAPTAPFGQWARLLAQYAESEVVRGELEYWVSQVSGDTATIPPDYTLGADSTSRNVAASSRLAVGSLGKEATKSLLYEVPKAYKTQISDILLAALVITLFRLTGKKSLLVALEGHGREPITDDIDLTRTVGWFTSIYPVLLTVRDPGDPGTTLKAVKESLRAVPNGGLGYGLLRYGHANLDARNRLGLLSQPQIVFNYLGQFNQLAADSGLSWSPTAAAGASQSPKMRRPFLLEVNGGIMGGELTMRWTYSADVHQASTIERLALDYMEELRGLIEHCKSPEAVGFTPSDFPQMKFSQDELDKLVAEFDG
jgi:amino acid adenylation domain-containing protein/non-ribosomal peptide synthase protein (TIGR01720 family)